MYLRFVGENAFIRAKEFARGLMSACGLRRQPRAWSKGADFLVQADEGMTFPVPIWRHGKETLGGAPHFEAIPDDFIEADLGL